MLTPYWNSLADFLNMGGYALYVWGAFLVNALIFIIEPIWLKRQKQKNIQNIKVFYTLHD